MGPQALPSISSTSTPQIEAPTPTPYAQVSDGRNHPDTQGEWHRKYHTAAAASSIARPQPAPPFPSNQAPQWLTPPPDLPRPTLNQPWTARYLPADHPPQPQARAVPRYQPPYAIQEKETRPHTEAHTEAHIEAHTRRPAPPPPGLRRPNLPPRTPLSFNIHGAYMPENPFADPVSDIRPPSYASEIDREGSPIPGVATPGIETPGTATPNSETADTRSPDPGAGFSRLTNPTTARYIPIDSPRPVPQPAPGPPFQDLRRHDSAASRRSARNSGPGTHGSTAKEIPEEKVQEVTPEGDKSRLARKFISTLCEAMMLYGAPSHRIEDLMTRLAEELGLKGCQFVYVPGVMHITFGDRDFPTPISHVVRIDQDLNLRRLRDVYELYKDVFHGDLTIREAQGTLDEYLAENEQKHRDKLRVAIKVVCQGCASAIVAPVAFHAGLKDMGAVFVLALAFGILRHVAARSSETGSYVLECFCSMVASGVGRWLGSMDRGESWCFGAIAMGAIALMLPGYMLVCASLELHSRKMVAGAVRMMHALIYMLSLTYGMALGTIFVPRANEGNMDALRELSCKSTMEAHPDSKKYKYLLVAAFALIMSIGHQAHWRQVPKMTGLAVVGYTVMQALAEIVTKGGAPVSVAGAALSVGLLANAPSRVLYWEELTWMVSCLTGFVPASVPSDREWIASKVYFLLGPRLSSAVGLNPPSAPSDCDIGKGNKPEDSHECGGCHFGLGRVKRHLFRLWNLLLDLILTLITGSSRADYRYSCAAASMMPAIWVLVPSGLAATSSLLAGVASASRATPTDGKDPNMGGAIFGGMGYVTINLVCSVLQMAVGVSLGLLLSVVALYPVGKGKNKSGIFSL